jgi:hypothetical protein
MLARLIARPLALSLAVVTFALGGIAASRAVAAASPAGSDAVAIKFRFGMKDMDATDWSGKLNVSSGKVESIRGWRWMPGDHANGNEFTVHTRRQAAQSEQERKRVQEGGKLPMNDNGIVATLSGVDANTEVSFEAGPGKASIKLSELTYGARVIKLDGNLIIERAPAVATLAESMADEDYPAVATAKDGTVYLVYLAFTRGKDFQGARERPATAESGPNTGPLAQGVVKKIEKPEDLDYLAQPTGGEQIFLRTYRNGAWSQPVAVTDGKNEYYRPAIAVDGKGKVWVFYSAHLDTNATLDEGNWELMAKSFDAEGKTGGAAMNISNAPGTDFMPAACTDSKGNIVVTWVGGRETNFNVFVAQQDGEKFSTPKAVNEAKSNQWEPAIAADANGNVALAWDTYDKGDYDVHLSVRDASGKWSKPEVVAGTAAFEVRASLAYDNAGRLWVAYEGSGDLWGKDFGALKKKGIPIYGGGRYVAVKVRGSDGAWSIPADVMAAVPAPNRPAAARAAANPNQQNRNQIAPCYPRIAVDPSGSVYMTFRGRPGGNWRVGVGSVWCEYVTHLAGDAWSTAAWIPRSNDVLDNRPAVTASADGLLAFFAGDGRGELNAPKAGDPDEKALLSQPRDAAEAAAAAELIDRAVADTAAADDGILINAGADNQAAADAEPKNPKKKAGGGGARRGAGQPDPNQDIFVAFIRKADLPPSQGAIKLTPAPKEVPPAGPSADTQAERQAVQTMRDYRYQLNGETLRVWRGEFHRHTEYSPDGGGDGGLLDLWRYAIDAVNNDWIGDGDHDYGNGREYTWWTTQKCVTLFTLPGRFTPVFSYERSVVYPEGHRNCMFAQRGVRSLPRMPLSSADKEAPAPDTNLVYMYLHHFKGLCASHTSATNMGTDWRNNDPEVEPWVEIYQGDRNNYERPDAPRTAVTEAKLKQSTPEKESLGGWRPKGFVNLALQKGYRLGFECSSDHVSTHLSFANVLVTGEPTRQAILDAIRKRRVYAATDNILADVRCKAGGKDHLMGEEFSTNEAPTIAVNLIGTQKFAKVVIVKDDVVVHEVTPNEQKVSFNWTDPKPTQGKVSYYYVRGEQVPDPTTPGVSSGELVWASPMWIKYEGK